MVVTACHHGLIVPLCVGQEQKYVRACVITLLLDVAGVLVILQFPVGKKDIAPEIAQVFIF